MNECEEVLVCLHIEREDSRSIPTPSRTHLVLVSLPPQPLDQLLVLIHQGFGLDLRPGRGLPGGVQARDEAAEVPEPLSYWG